MVRAVCIDAYVTTSEHRRPPCGRKALGTSLAIVVLGGVAGSIGKAITGQIDWLLSLAFVVGALSGGHFGAATSKYLSTRTLVVLLGLLIGFVTIGLWWDVLQGVAFPDRRVRTRFTFRDHTSSSCATV